MNRHLKYIIIGILAIFALSACLPVDAYVDYNGDGNIDADERKWREAELFNQVRASIAANSHSSTDCIGEMKRHWPAHLHGWAANVIHRESRGDARAQNSGSSAAGCFQLIHSLHAGKYPANCRDRYNAHCNVQAAWNLYQQDSRAWRFSG